jgi:hypothetical protein
MLFCKLRKKYLMIDDDGGPSLNFAIIKAGKLSCLAERECLFSRVSMGVPLYFEANVRSRKSNPVIM